MNLIIECSPCGKRELTSSPLAAERRGWDNVVAADSFDYKPDILDADLYGRCDRCRPDTEPSNVNSTEGYQGKRDGGFGLLSS